MSLIPERFFIRLAHSCPYVKDIPRIKQHRLLDLPENARLTRLEGWDGKKSFADVRLAWNESGLGVQVVVRGKQLSPASGTLRTADGLTLWLDTRDARHTHRASRFCHQFHFLPIGGSDQDEPLFTQTKINRAIQDAPLARPSDVLFQSVTLSDGYRMEAFLSSSAISGFDPDQHPRWGIYYLVRDQELGDQFLGVGWDFPFYEDPSLWDVVELVK